MVIVVILVNVINEFLVDIFFYDMEIMLVWRWFGDGYVDVFELVVNLFYVGFILVVVWVKMWVKL